MTWKIPLSAPLLGSEEMQAAQRVLASGWLTMGEETQAFEEEFANFLGVKHALACSSGTAALHLAMLAVGIGRGSKVIQPAVNFVAAANMTMACGAEPLLTDILALDEPTLAPNELMRWLEATEGETPEAIDGSGVGPDRAIPLAVVVMHYGGFPCRMDEILPLCRERGIPVIEDACHSPGGRTRVEGFDGGVPQGLSDHLESRTQTTRLGTLGDVGCFSFFSNKNLATGEGGMVVTDRDDLAAKLRSLRSHGMTTLTWDRHRGHAASYDVTAHGFNYRIDELRSAIGREQLRKLAASNQRRRALTALYWEALAPLEARGWLPPFKARFAGLGLEDSACHLMTLVAPNRDHRWRAADSLREAGIQTSLHYPFIPAFGAFSRQVSQPEFCQDHLPLAAEYSARTLTLPLYPAMTEADIRTVADVLLRSTHEFDA